MARDLTKLGPKGLANVLERREARRSKAGDMVFALAAHGNERFNDVCARLGAEHPAVVAHHAARAANDEALDECRRRYGPAVTFDSLWVTFLRVRAVA